MKDVSDRNCLKKAGQLEAVKLLPKVVSNGLGKGELDGGIGAPVEVVDGEPCEVEFPAGVMVNCMSTDDVFDGPLEVFEGAAVVVVEVSNGDPFCRAYNSSTPAGGSGRRSTRISPLLAN